MGALVASDELDRLIDENLALPGRAEGPFAGDVVQRWLPQLLDGGPGVEAVVLYGSCLHAATASSDSEPDFYVIVDGLRRYHAHLGRAALGTLLAPSVYHRRLVIDGRARFAKVCVLSREQLLRDTSPAAADLHQLGRFSKRIALVWSRSDDARRLVTHAQRTSLEAMTDHALALLDGEFTLQELALTWIGLSYRAEPRIAEPGKLEALLSSARDFYVAAARLLLAERGIEPRADCRYVRPFPVDARATLSLIRRSRVRERMRWPLYLVTFDGWLDYLVRKLGRHGQPPLLTDRARRHPLLFGWRAFADLQRQGRLT